MLKKFNKYINISIIISLLYLLVGGLIVFYPTTSIKVKLLPGQIDLLCGTSLCPQENLTYSVNK